ncbi:MAG: CpsD/CapB family tyrosine-protein kinase [candidate division Zixibacteria bacterium]|nr:CpsD/CapB family tyrosine-protein kinase [candidate division Zixibacteria bacterium]
MRIESIINYFDRESVGATEFRRLFSNIHKTNKDGLKSVMVTSSGVEEGKSTISSFLAISIAESTDNKVLLLDTDLRRPMINVFFKLPLERGFSDLLEKNCSTKETIKETAVQGLSIITAGTLTTEPTLIMNQTRLKEIFEELKFYFDFIVVDVPPVIPVSDPVIIASEVEGTLMVVRAGKTPKEVVKRAINFLNNSKINVLGVVMNNLDEVLPYYYSPKYYSYKYYDKSNEHAKI